MKKIIYNYYLKNEKHNILFSIHILKEVLHLFVYNNGILHELKTNVYSIDKDKIVFNNNVFSNNKIKYLNQIDVSFECVKRNIFFNKINMVKATGIIDNEKNSDLILYHDIEIHKKPCVEYTKLIYISNVLEDCFSYSSFNYLNNSKIVIYLNVNDLIVKDNSHIISKNKGNSIITKTYQYIYNIDYAIENSENSKQIIKFSKVNCNVKVHKMFYEPFVNLNKQQMILISYKI